MKILLTINLFILFIAPSMQAQSVRISGRVADEESRGVPGASVMLLNKENRGVVKGLYSGSDGSFTISSNQNIPMILRIEHLSYDPNEISLPVPCDTVVEIRLKMTAHRLDEISFVGRRETFQYREDGNMVVNIENIPGYETDNTSEILKKLPGVFVDEMGKSVMLNGMPIELQLDGKRMQLPDLTALLKAMPAIALDQVELISNKTAEYDGSAEAVINLVTKRKRGLDGYLGNIEGSIGRERNNEYVGDGNVFFMLMKNRFYLQQYVVLGKENDSGSSFDSTYYGNSGDYVTRYESGAARSTFVQSNTNLSWDVGRNLHKLSANLFFTNKVSHDYPIANGYSSKTGTMLSENYQKWHPTQFSGNIEFETSDSLNYKLKTSYGYVGAWYRNDYSYENTYEGGLVDVFDYDLYNDGSQNIVKLDFSKKFFNKLNFRVGAKGDFGHATTDNKYTPETSVRKSSLFEYNENVIAEYTSLSMWVTKKMSAYIGLRTEYTYYTLDYQSEGARGSNDYWNFLPSANISYNVSKNYRPSLQFTSSVGRPNYNMLMPNVEYVNDNYYTSGNPYLKPYRSYGVALSNRLFNIVTLTVGGQARYDLYSRVLVDEGNDVTLSTYKNCVDYRGGYVTFSANSQMFKRKLYGNLTGTYRFGEYVNPRNGYTMADERGELRNFTSSAYLSYNVTDRLRVSGSAIYTGNQVDLQTDTRDKFYASFSAQYAFFKDRNLIASLTFIDPWNRQGKNYTTTYYDDNVMTRSTDYHFQAIQLSVTWNFRGGKSFKRQQTQEDANADDKRLNEN